MTTLRSEDTICAIASAPGEGAVGVLRLSGPRAGALLEQVCGRLPQPRRLLLRTVTDPRSELVVDRALVCSMPGPQSYTGEDVVEVFGHGGPLNMRALLSLFIDLGARQAEPGEFTRRAFLHGKLDLTQAEAVAEIVTARSERALRNAQAVLGGELGTRIRSLRAAAIELAAELEASIDFADELQLASSEGELLGRFDALLTALRQLLASYRVGAKLDGITVALVGAVNVGKSSLFNALLGKERALVSPAAGTTRDYLEGEVSWQGVRVTLVDTAGVREAREMSTLERAGHLLGERRVAEADLRLCLVDGTDEPRSLEGDAQRDLFVCTKSDRVTAAKREAWRAWPEAPLLTSAESGEGLEELAAAVLARLLPAGLGGDGAETVCVTQARQADGLSRAERALAAGRAAQAQALVPELVVEHVQEALGALGEITGEDYREDVLGAVFSRFCIGK